ncbi:MAG: AbrB/MazE/SpoVT family DNA-binding domain-containing protein [archaeon GB-1867-005]|nr:AbrB/MazE/SpoVT family DNA-binding domain-containing protein [Candidatus Culexmicrobium cathedralense]
MKSKIVFLRKIYKSYYIPLPIKIVRELNWKEGELLKLEKGDGELRIKKLEVKEGEDESG